MKKQGKVLGLISIKGGVGKTTSVINLASSLAKDYNKKVVVVDANFSSPNVALHLGSVDHKSHLHHVLNDEVHISESLYDSGFGFHFVPSSLVHMKTNFNKLKDTVKTLKKHYDYVLIDSSPSLNNELAAAINASDELYVVSTPDIPTLSTTLRAVKLAKGSGMHVKGLILNKLRNKSYEIKPHDMERLAGVPIVGVVHNDIKVSEALSELKPVVLHSPHSKSSLSYKELAAYISGEEFKHPGKIKLAVSRLKDDYENFKKHDFKSGLMYYK